MSRQTCLPPTLGNILSYPLIGSLNIRYLDRGPLLRVALQSTTRSLILLRVLRSITSGQVPDDRREWKQCSKVTHLIVESESSNFRGVVIGLCGTREISGHITNPSGSPLLAEWKVSLPKVPKEVVPRLGLSI